MTESPKMNSALSADPLEVGGVVTEYHGRTLVRHTSEILPPNMLLRQRQQLCSIGATGLD